MTVSLTNFLLELSERSRREGLDPDTFRLRVRRQDLADHLGLTLGGLGREFERLIFRGAIVVDAEDTVTILDRAALGPAPGDAPARRAIAPLPGAPDERTEYALRTILSDKQFLDAPGVPALLVYLVEKLSADGTDHAAATLAAVEVLGRPAGFDPEEPILRALVTRLRERLHAYDTSATDPALAPRPDADTPRRSGDRRRRRSSD